MLIKETVERECCQPGDLLPVLARPYTPPAYHPYYFCKHCGRWWKEVGRMGPAGSTDYNVEPLPWPWQVSPLSRKICACAGCSNKAEMVQGPYCHECNTKTLKVWGP